jgi:uncharacterized phage-associated protein
MARANDVAKYFLMLTASGVEDAGEAMTHLKLQKLLYYTQGFHLALYNEPLFADRIEAWGHGPVVNTLWGVYRGYGAAPIPAAEDFDPDETLAAQQKALLNDVWNAYGQFSAWKLRDMTHREPPWRDAYRPGENAVIPQDSMRGYFATQLQP